VSPRNNGSKSSNGGGLLPAIPAALVPLEPLEPVPPALHGRVQSAPASGAGGNSSKDCAGLDAEVRVPLDVGAIAQLHKAAEPPSHPLPLPWSHSSVRGTITAPCGAEAMEMAPMVGGHMGRGGRGNGSNPLPEGAPRLSPRQALTSHVLTEINWQALTSHVLTEINCDVTRGAPRRCGRRWSAYAHGSPPQTPRTGCAPTPSGGGPAYSTGAGPPLADLVHSHAATPAGLD
jgi:hypothetical protein